MYACGPTVYDYGHIGNFRTFVQIDVLRRFLLLTGTRLRHVMNITDVDDKIIRNAAAAGNSIHDYSAPFEQAFLEDLDALRIQHPEQLARATEHIDRMVELIQKLAAAGAAYQTEDGSWYFRLSAFPEYGKLSKKDLSGMEDGARVDVDEYEKDSARDFALWKAAKPGETFWDTAIGRGRPGWHIECSAMAMEYLGDELRPARRRRRPDVPAPRKRDCAKRNRNPQALRAPLDARSLSACRRAQDVEERGELLYPARLAAEGLQSLRDSDGADFGSLPAPAELHLRRAGRRHQRHRAAEDVPSAATVWNLCGRRKSRVAGSREEGAGTTTWLRLPTT